MVRVSWEEATQIIAAAYVHTIKAYGPDRIAGFSVIPAMSMVSYGAGSRFTELLGGTMLSFYDWYADLPQPALRYSATKPTCQRPVTGSTPNTSSCGDPTSP